MRGPRVIGTLAPQRDGTEAMLNGNVVFGNMPECFSCVDP